jgi:hypothetical protein
MNGQRSTATPNTVEEASKIDETQLCDVLDYCSKELGLQGLTSLAATSKQYKQASAATTARDAYLFLKDGLTAAHAAGGAKYAASSSLEQRMQAVTWLLRVDPSATTAAAAAKRLLSIPNVPLPMAKQLVEAGVRMKFSQLKAAAEKMVPGVDVWVLAQRQQGVPTDIPGLAASLFRPFPSSRIVSAARYKQAAVIAVFHCLLFQGDVAAVPGGSRCMQCWVWALLIRQKAQCGAFHEWVRT